MTVGCPIEVLGTDDVCHQRNYKTLTLGLTDVVDYGWERRSWCCLVEQQDVVRGPIIIHATADATVEETEVETQVEGRCLLPSQVRVTHLTRNLTSHVVVA